MYRANHMQVVSDYRRLKTWTDCASRSAGFHCVSARAINVDVCAGPEAGFDR